MHPFHRSELLLGGEGFDRMTASSACVIGLGGVGSYAAEALVRTGIGRVVLVDFDVVCITNVNRQLHATRKTVRKFKSELMAQRAQAINPRAEIVAKNVFYGPDTADDILGDGYDIVFDCIDNMTAKLHLLQTCVQRDQYVVSAMGAGGRMDPTRVQVSDLSLTRIDPFAKIVRKELRKRGVQTGITCVWSDEHPLDIDEAAEAAFRCICPDKDLKSQHSCEQRMQVQGTVSWMPAIFGLTMAGVAVQHLLGRPIQTVGGS
ncbi:MAG: tRNA threonylcarbamoyladenosine dehydratase [Myxococcales bacterium]|nr:tRNA threonylcarbamoyladenosine dehydratase [Myxococcales bacterium]